MKTLRQWLARCHHEHYKVSEKTERACGRGYCDRGAHKAFTRKIATCIACGAVGRYTPSGYDDYERVTGWEKALKNEVQQIVQHAPDICQLPINRFGVCTGGHRKVSPVTRAEGSPCGVRVD